MALSSSGASLTDPAARVAELLSAYGASDASAAHLLCDKHDPARVVYRLVDEDLSTEVLTYGELRAESERFAGVLTSLGIGPGDRVATLMAKSREYLITILGIWRLGAVHVPLFTAFAPSAIAMRLTASATRVVVCDGKQQSKLEGNDDIPREPPWQVITTGVPKTGWHSFASLMSLARPGVTSAKLGGESPLIHIYTSGTTGNPKGVVVPIRALASFQIYFDYALDLRPDDVFWCAADPGWAYGLYFGIIATLMTGTPSVLFKGPFSPATTWAVLEKERVSNFSAAPTVYRSLRSSESPPLGRIRLRCASSAGEPLTPEVNEWAQGALGVTVYDHYGQTEMGMLINNHHHPLLKRPLKAGSMGHVMPGFTAVVLKQETDELAAPGETGRIALTLAESSLAFFGGYHHESGKSAEKFTKDGRWYLTGDTGAMDAEGYFRFSSRDDDVILMAGYRIGPSEIEAVLQTHVAIRESAVIAVPDDIRGEVMEAFAVLKAGEEAGGALEESIKQWVKVRYAAHAFPRVVHFVAQLPKTPSGKIQRAVLRQQRREELAQAQRDADSSQAAAR